MFFVLPQKESLRFLLLILRPPTEGVIEDTDVIAKLIVLFSALLAESASVYQVFIVDLMMR